MVEPRRAGERLLRLVTMPGTIGEPGWLAIDHGLSWLLVHTLLYFPRLFQAAKKSMWFELRGPVREKPVRVGLLSCFQDVSTVGGWGCGDVWLLLLVTGEPRRPP